MLSFQKIAFDDSSKINYIRSKLHKYPLECFDLYYKNRDILDPKWEVTLIGASYNNQLVGFVFGDDGGLNFIYVEPKYRLRTIGTRLLILLEKELKKPTAFFKNKLKMAGSNYPGDPGFINFFS